MYMHIIYLTLPIQVYQGWNNGMVYMYMVVGTDIIWMLVDQYVHASML